MYKKYYGEFLKHHQGKLHFAAHSHHFWPDITRSAHLEYWDDSAKFSDEKWGHIFETVIPETQKLIAEVLNLSSPEMITFAGSTHELLTRLLSALDWNNEVSILTTDSEFHSFKRQTERLVETGKLKLDIVPTEPFSTFEQRFQEKSKTTKYNLVFISQVFFNSAICLKNLKSLVEACDEKTLFVLDGYHAFMAIPTDLSEFEGRIFYLSGGYKYAQAGEGACFMVSPKSCTLRPIYTGWFASFSTLEKKNIDVQYDKEAYRFMGSTFDASGIYRLRAVLELFKKDQLTVSKIHQHVQSLQKYFLIHLRNQYLSNENLLKHDLENHGHFLTFRLKSIEQVRELHLKLKEKGILTDFRGDRLRFGFGLYHDEMDIKELFSKL
ncbi:MAG: aminotransferase class V-fold PLP-dependent enzyme [Bacteriovoracaceae bacterium]